MIAGAGATVRVWIVDVWDAVDIVVPSHRTFAEVKAESLARALGRSVDPSRYEMKYRGALVLDEEQTLMAHGVPDRAPLIVLPTHRRPVR